MAEDLTELLARLEKEVHDEAWHQFRRMPSSNPSDYAWHFLRVVRPVIRELHEAALEPTTTPPKEQS